MTRIPQFLLAVCLTAVPALLSAEVAVSLKGSRSSMERQNAIARAEQYSFLRTTAQVRKFVDNGYLVELPGNDDYRVLAGHPFARPVVRAFIERLGSDYRDACGERLVVTSLTRPAGKQPRNASPLSVHPAGMAVDLRVPANGTCLKWLSSELLTLENGGLLDATREFRPPHFHIAVFPAEYAAYHEARLAEEAVAEAERRLEAAVALREAEAAQAHADMLAGETAAAEAAGQGTPAELPLLLRIAVAVVTLVLPV
jgi:hypothetical protein